MIFSDTVTTFKFGGDDTTRLYNTALCKTMARYFGLFTLLTALLGGASSGGNNSNSTTKLGQTLQ